MKRLNTLNSFGSVLLPIIIIMPAAFVIIASVMQLTIGSIRIAKSDEHGTHAQLAADAGVDSALREINLNEAWAGTPGEINLLNNSDIRTTYEVSISTIGADDKTLESTGRVYRPASATTPERSITIQVDIQAIRSSGFSIVTGVGGLYLSNSAKVLGGDVFVNGEIDMQNSAQIGLSTEPVKVSVAHQNCPDPANSSYPRLCGDSEGGQPIQLKNSAHIYADVYANNQTNGSDMSDGGLMLDQDGDTDGNNIVEPLPLPEHVRQAQVDAVTTTRSGSNASCTNNGSKTWAANTKINGDVEISKKCTVTIQGDVWITGKFTMENSGKLVIAEGLTEEPDIMTDDKDTKFKNSSAIVSNSSNIGARVINYWSKASCSPDCIEVTGNDLYDTRNEITIELDNSAEGPNSIFYSKWSRVLISNSGQIGALVGQTVELKNSGAITFGANAGAGGDAFWVISNYRRKIL